MEDMKAALGNGSKPDLTHVRRVLMVYIARACEYGNAKGYERANYMRPYKDNTPKDNFERLREYTRSGINHMQLMLDEMEKHLALDPKLVDVAGMKAACYAPDKDDPKNGTVGASMLPHFAHGMAGFMMTLVQAVMYGQLPEDPGQPWTEDLNVLKAKAVRRKCVPAETDKPTQTVDPTGLISQTETYKCQHGLSCGVYCESCQQYTREPVRK